MNLLKLIPIVSFFKVCLAHTIHNLAFMIIGQEDDYHLKLVHALKNEIKMQLSNSTTIVPQIFIYPENIPDKTGWTIYPLLLPILDNITDNTEWIIFVEDRTKVNVKLLIETLEKYDINSELWIGHALTDNEATIIHHFAFFKEPSFFKYPNSGSGFAMTVPLFKKVCKEISNEIYDPPNFHIDVSHEFALFVSHEGTRNMLQHDESLCSKEGPNCATYPAKFQPCGEQRIYPIYVVKTFHKFHHTRVRILQETWGQYTDDLIFFSDRQDTSIPTIRLDVENTEQGHCSKTIELLKYVERMLESVNDKQWIILADDDTILSVSKISKLLTCFNATSSPVMIGERYRFSLNGDGYDYLTGGAGIVISIKAVKILANQCHCPKPDSPDDMILGACAKMFGISLVHFPYFHQARPVDYSQGYLDTNDAVSFHKHWMLDPVLVYNQYFRKEDALFFNNVSFNVQQSKKDEL